MQPAGFLRHPLSLIVCVCACACGVLMCQCAQTIALPMCFMASVYVSCRDSTGIQNKVDIHRDL